MRESHVGSGKTCGIVAVCSLLLFLSARDGDACRDLLTEITVEETSISFLRCMRSTGVLGMAKMVVSDQSGQMLLV